MQVFWERGYEGTSLADLTEAMGINRPSLYGTFGNKEELFAEALALYEADGGRSDYSTAQRGSDRPGSDRGNPSLPCAGLRGRRPAARLHDCSVARLSAPPSAARYATCWPNAAAWARTNCGERIERGQAEGDVPADTDARHLAAFYTTILQGMSSHGA